MKMENSKSAEVPFKLYEKCFAMTMGRGERMQKTTTKIGHQELKIGSAHPKTRKVKPTTLANDKDKTVLTPPILEELAKIFNC